MSLFWCLGITAILPPLTTAQTQRFAEDGYCVVDNLFTENELSEIEAFFEEYKTTGARVFDDNKGYEEIDPKKRQLRAMHPHIATANGWSAGS